MTLAANGLPTLAEIRKSPHDFLGRLDIAAFNLLCAFGLPGAEGVDIAKHLAWLDEAADAIRIDKEAGYDRFLDAPAAFGNSQAKFCIVQMVTVLQRRFGVRYNPRWQEFTPDNPPPREFGVDANDVFIHAIINGVGGTCASLPILYVAIGRRLGYPLKLVKAYRHLFVRWDDPEGQRWFHAERFNIEATEGVHFLPDDHYKTWPHEVSSDDIEAGIFLKSLSPAEELAECLATRGHCLVDNDRIAEAVQVFESAAQFSPSNRYFELAHQRLRMYLAMMERGHAFLEASASPRMDYPLAPTWTIGNDGREMLVQVLRLGHYHSPPPTMSRVPLIAHMVQLPNGQAAHAHVPVSGPHNRLEAEWLQLPGNEYALIHRQSSNQWQPFAQSTRPQQNGIPILPIKPPIPHHGIRKYQRHELVARIERLRTPAHLQGNRQTPQLGLALPPSPIRPRLTAH